MEQEDKKSLEFHIKEQDYFGTLATVLDLYTQDLVLNLLAQDSDGMRAMLKDTIDDLVYLQERYKIVRREPD